LRCSGPVTNEKKTTMNSICRRYIVPGHKSNPGLVCSLGTPVPNQCGPGGQGIPSATAALSNPSPARNSIPGGIVFFRSRLGALREQFVESAAADNVRGSTRCFEVVVDDAAKPPIIPDGRNELVGFRALGVEVGPFAPEVECLVFPGQKGDLFENGRLDQLASGEDAPSERGGRFGSRVRNEIALDESR